ncbi:MAG: amidohydrolase family protein [Planctomycetota bacterium]
MMRDATAADPSTWVDAHLHAWDTEVLAPPWIAQAPQFAGRFDLARYFAEGGVRGGLVFVEADVAHEDRAREAQLFARWGAAAGVPHASVACIEPGAAGFARELASIGSAHAVRGARRVLHAGDLPFGSQRFVEGLHALGAAGLSFDFCVRWTDIARVEACARAAPATRLVLDHLGNPPLREGWASPARGAWQRLVARAASCPNVSVKWSAMFENAGRALAAEEIRPWFEWCVACFGPERTMWGSNWPVCFAGARLTQWTDACAAIGSSLTAGEQAAVFGWTARRVYGLEGATSADAPGFGPRR